LVGEPQHGNPSKLLQVVKQKVSQSLREGKTSSGSQMESTFASDSVAAPALWQRRFYDFCVWSEKKLKEKLHYMHRNPVDRKWVQHPQDWP
jgi:REP element-mobilizing transposase RayT